MRTTNSITFYCRRSKMTKANLSPIEMSICINGRRVFINLPLKANPDTFRREYSDYLASMHSKVTTAIIQLTERNLPVTADALREFIRWGGIKSYTLSSLWDDFLASIRPKVAIGTYKKYEVTRQSFCTFIGQEKDIKAITRGDVTRWYNNLLLRLQAGTIVGMVTKVKTFFQYAVENEFIQSNPVVIKPKRPTINTEYLTTEELSRIASIRLNKRLEKIRDLFLLQCYCGLSYSDILALKEDEIHRVSSVGVVMKKRVKTGTEYTAIILPDGMAIIDKNNGIPEICSNQVYNRYLQEIETLCGLEKHLHSHLARHTYATGLLNAGVRLEVVSRALGHSNTLITQKVYAKLEDRTVVDEVMRICQ